ncbi:hypothetical protein ACJX0J_041315, partial [Zea mays]
MVANLTPETIIESQKKRILLRCIDGSHVKRISNWFKDNNDSSDICLTCLALRRVERLLNPILLYRCFGLSTRESNIFLDLAKNLIITITFVEENILRFEFS